MSDTHTRLQIPAQTLARLGLGPKATGTQVLAALRSKLNRHPHVTPLVRNLARDHGVNLNGVTGTGAGGRTTASDVRAAAGLSAPPDPEDLDEFAHLFPPEPAQGEDDLDVEFASLFPPQES